jgi:hypothetical protein
MGPYGESKASAGHPSSTTGRASRTERRKVLTKTFRALRRFPVALQHLRSNLWKTVSDTIFVIESITKKRPHGMAASDIAVITIHLFSSSLRSSTQRRAGMSEAGFRISSSLKTGSTRTRSVSPSGAHATFHFRPRALTMSPFSMVINTSLFKC